MARYSSSEVGRLRGGCGSKRNLSGDEWLVRLENRGGILDRKGIPRWETTKWSVAAARRSRGRISRAIQNGLGMDYIYGKEGSLDLLIEI